MSFRPIKFKIGMTKEPVDQPVNLMDIYNRVKLKKLQAEISQTEQELNQQ